MRRSRAVQLIIFGAAIGVVAGVGGHTFFYAKGGSYLTNDPAACANCHVMRQHYDAWIRSSHRSVAACNDCHVPKDLLGKYATKLTNGWEHSYAFTTGDFHEPIRIKPHSLGIVEKSCLKCHQDVVEGIAGGHSGIEPISCTACHADVGHDL